MNIIVSGANGYIGLSLIRKLKDIGFTPGMICRNSNHISQEKGELFIADISKPLDISLNKKYDLLIHLAAANDVDSRNPSTALSVTSLGTRNILEYCKKNQIRKVIYFSTFQVYGKVDGDMREGTACSPQNDYAMTHFFAEEYIKMYHATDRIEFIILRPTNIYGAPLYNSVDRWTLVPNCFCKEAIETGTITLMSSGKQKRDFLNLNDLVNITAKLSNEFDRYKNQVINVSSGNDFTILEISQLVKQQYEKIFQKKCEIIIRSEKPEITNSYSIDRALISSLSYSFENRRGILEEINAIFNLLKTNK